MLDCVEMVCGLVWGVVKFFGSRYSACEVWISSYMLVVLFGVLLGLLWCRYGLL
jgi:hypothetical protein